HHPLILPSPLPISTLSLHDALPISCCPRRRGFLIVRCSKSPASSTSPRAPSCFRRTPARHVTSEFLLLAEKSPLPVIRTWEQRSDRKSTRLNSSHQIISYAVFCLKK